VPAWRLFKRAARLSAVGSGERQRNERCSFSLLPLSPLSLSLSNRFQRTVFGTCGCIGCCYVRFSHVEDHAIGLKAATFIRNGEDCREILRGEERLIVALQRRLVNPVRILDGI